MKKEIYKIIGVENAFDINISLVYPIFQKAGEPDKYYIQGELVEGTKNKRFVEVDINNLNNFRLLKNMTSITSNGQAQCESINVFDNMFQCAFELSSKMVFIGNMEQMLMFLKSFYLQNDFYKFNEEYTKKEIRSCYNAFNYIISKKTKCLKKEI